MTDSRLVIAVVRAEERHELAQQIRLLVRMLRRTHPEHGVGRRFLADGENLVADFVDRLVPTDLLPLAADELHRRFQPMLAMTVLARGRAFGAMGAERQRRSEHGLLPHPSAVFDDRADRASNRA